MRSGDIRNALDEPALRKRFGTLRIVVIAIAVCPILYVAAGFLFAAGRGTLQVNPASNLILLLLYIISALMAVMGIFMPERKVAGSSLPAGDDTSGPKLPPDRGRLGAYVNGFYKVVILRTALFEAIGIYGLVGCLMTGDTLILIALNLFAVLFIMLHYPSPDRFASFVERLEGKGA
jgi:high-affinity Fe2+/Pb2+ permease